MIDAPPVPAVLAEAPALAVRTPFAPPTDRDLILEIVQTREAPQGRKRFTMVSRLRFARDGDGWSMAETLDRIDADADADADAGERAARIFRAGKAPFVGQPVVTRLDADGRITGVDDEAGAWRLFAEGQAAVADLVAALPDVATVDRQAILAVVDGILNGPPEVRRRHLLGGVEPVVAQAGRQLSTATPVAFTNPAGGATGDLRLVRVEGGIAELALVSATRPGALDTVSERRTIRVDIATGLVLDERRETRIGTGPDALHSIETRTLTMPR